MFDHILLEPEQKELLIALVEAARSVRREERQKFIFVQTLADSFIQHPGFSNKTYIAYKGDIETLGREGLIAITFGRYAISFDVTPKGFKYYEHLKQQLGGSVQRVEASIRHFLEAETFRQKYSLAYQKWDQAERMLWAHDVEQHFSTIGHLCREAVQEFAEVLINKYQPPGDFSDKTKVISRVRAVFELQIGRKKSGTTVKSFLDALLKYWQETINLIQRQEHAGQKEGEPIVWEDARRVVFMTAVAMFEIDRAL